MTFPLQYCLYPRIFYHFATEYFAPKVSMLSHKTFTHWDLPTSKTIRACLRELCISTDYLQTQYFYGLRPKSNNLKRKGSIYSEGMCSWRCRPHGNRYAFCCCNKRRSTGSHFLNQYRILYQATNPALFPGKLDGVEILCRRSVVSSSLHQAFGVWMSPYRQPSMNLGNSCCRWAALITLSWQVSDLEAPTLRLRPSKSQWNCSTSRNFVWYEYVHMLSFWEIM